MRDPITGFNFIVKDGAVTVTKYRGDGGAVIIPSELNGFPVTTIGEEIFNECSSITSVTIPDSVTSIERWAFGDCINLVKVTIPSGLTFIWDGAFCRCSGLAKITIPNSVTCIDSLAFGECTNLSSVTFNEENVEATGKFINQGGTDIGELAFRGCNSLTSIIIPNSITFIRKRAFLSCKNLAEVTINSIYINIGEAAFADCPNLKTVHLSRKINISDNVFEGSPTELVYTD